MNNKLSCFFSLFAGENMKQKVLMLDEFYATGFADGIRDRLGYEVIFTDSLDQGKEETQTGIDLLVIEPFLYNSGVQQEQAIQVINEAKSQKIPIYVFSSQTLRTLNERGFNFDDDVKYSHKTIHPDNFYKNIAELVEGKAF